MKNLIRDSFRYFANLPGWKTKRKIVIFESDDWGSIRVPSKMAFDFLKSKGVDLTSCDSARYSQNDTLASADDLTALFDLLQSHKDMNGRPCVFTPLCLVANPDFEKIEASEFKRYYYEPFTLTLQKYPGCENSFKLWQEGMRSGLFMPQFHGREHLNVTAWLKALQGNHKETMLAFGQKMWAIRSTTDFKVPEYQAALNIKDIVELEYLESVLSEGLDLFEQLFGYKATYFAPPNGYFNNSLEPLLHQKGIKYINSLYIQKEPLGYNKYKIRLHYLNQQNQLGQKYIIRNVLFEPNQTGHNQLRECLYRIDTAISLKKPAIISTHRTNYIGTLNPQNRSRGLLELDMLLRTIRKRYPDVEFMTTPELGRLMEDI